MHIRYLFIPNFLHCHSVNKNNKTGDLKNLGI